MTVAKARSLSFKYRPCTLVKVERVRELVLSGQGVKASCAASGVSLNSYLRWIKANRMDSVHLVVQEQRIQSGVDMVEGLYGKPLQRAVTELGIAYKTVNAMRAARGEVPWKVQRKLAREAACEIALASLLSGVSQEQACADAGVSVQHFRPWRAARGVVPSQGELRILRNRK